MKKIKPNVFVAKWSIYFLLYIMGIVFCLGIVTKHLTSQWIISAATYDLDRTQSAMAPIQRLNEENNQLESELETFKSKYPDPKREEIEKYVKLIFGKDANTALAVSHHECGYTNKTYPKCHLESSVEHSIGLFQVNLYNQKQWIHAGRIPGNTMAEKTKWLENPFNNTLYSYWVYQTSGWSPWSAYSTGRYLNDPLMKANHG